MTRFLPDFTDSRS